MKFFKQYSLCALAVAAAFPAFSQEVPPVVRLGRPATVVCENQIELVHMDKIIFRITGPLTAILDAEQAQLNAIPLNSSLDIKVLDNPRTVADLKGKVLSFLGAQDTVVNRARVTIDDVDYAVACGVPVD
jgi:hypothetical protein